MWLIRHTFVWWTSVVLLVSNSFDYSLRTKRWKRQRNHKSKFASDDTSVSSLWFLHVISRSGSVALSISRPNKNPGYDMFTYLRIVYSWRYLEQCSDDEDRNQSEDIFGEDSSGMIVLFEYWCTCSIVTL